MAAWLDDESVNGADDVIGFKNRKIRKKTPTGSGKRLARKPEIEIEIDDPPASPILLTSFQRPTEEDFDLVFEDQVNLRQTVSQKRNGKRTKGSCPNSAGSP